MRQTEKDQGADYASTITVTLGRKAGEYQLLIRAAGRSELIKSRPFTSDKIKTWRKQLVKHLGTVYDLWWQGKAYNTDFKKLSQSIEPLHSFSDSFLGELFGKGAPSLLCSYLDQVRQARIGDLLAWERPIGIIEYEALLDEFLPLDYLFLPHRGYNNAPKNLHELVLSLSNIIGFSYIIRRNPPRDLEHGLTSHDRQRSAVAGKRQVIIEYDDRLIADILAFLKLPHAEKEITFFHETNSHVFKVVEDPKQCGEYTAKTIVGRLLGRSDVQLHHFCCHCSAESDDPWEHFLRLGEVEVTLEDLTHHFEVYPGSNEAKTRERIAFLNACESAAVSPLSKASFPALFLEYFGHVGFIGPEHRIPDAFAYEFARVFYAHLFKLRDLGTALFKTRWFFAKKYNNPMGLFYTLYANGDVRLVGPDRYVHL
jgi:hypothetical protein